MDLEPGDVVAIPAEASGYHFAIVTNLIDSEGKPYVIWGSPTGAEVVRETPWEEFTRGEDAWRTDIRGGHHWTHVLREARARIGVALEHRRFVQIAHGLPVEELPPKKAQVAPWRALAGVAVAGAALAGLLLVVRTLIASR